MGSPLRDFFGEGRPAEGSDARSEARSDALSTSRDDLRHAQQGIVLDAFGGADEKHLAT